MSFNNIPTYNWLPPVGNSSLLPSGGQPGDVRIALDSQNIWVLDNTYTWVNKTNIGSPSNSFSTIQTDTGTYPTALTATSILDITTNNSTFFTVIGNSTTNTVTITTKYTPVNKSGDTMTGSLSVPSLLINTSTPVASSLVTIASTTQGFLLPRMTTAQRIAISSPANGLMLYDTDLLCPCFYDGTGWRKISYSSA
jgi:hypothetical protein